MLNGGVFYKNPGKTDPTVLAVRQIMKGHPQCPEEAKVIKPWETENMLKSSQLFPS